MISKGSARRNRHDGSTAVPALARRAVGGVALAAFALGAGALLVLPGQVEGQAQPAPATAENAQPVVIELFQSQGCSSCPPAIANLNALAGRSDLITLSYGVTYWDHLGWTDTFAKPEFTERQRRYAAGLKRNNVYTPQMVVGGRADLIGHRRGDVDRAIAADRAVPARARIERQGDAVVVSPWPGAGSGAETAGPAATPAAPATLWLVQYDPRTIDVAVRAGENSGRTLPHAHVVREISALGQWRGEAQRYALPAAGASANGLARVLLVQAQGHGPILAAAAL